MQRVDELEHRLIASIQHQLQLDQTHLKGLSQRITALSPMAVLERGYAIVTNLDGQSISKVGQVVKGEVLNVQISDGGFSVHVDEI
jgi:exodeoxyribonuclease VII large subunit